MISLFIFLLSTMSLVEAKYDVSLNTIQLSKAYNATYTSAKDAGVLEVNILKDQVAAEFEKRRNFIKACRNKAINKDKKMTDADCDQWFVSSGFAPDYTKENIEKRIIKYNLDKCFTELSQKFIEKVVPNLSCKGNKSCKLLHTTKVYPSLKDAGVVYYVDENKGFGCYLNTDLIRMAMIKVVLQNVECKYGTNECSADVILLDNCQTFKLPLAVNNFVSFRKEKYADVTPNCSGNKCETLTGNIRAELPGGLGFRSDYYGGNYTPATDEKNKTLVLIRDEDGFGFEVKIKSGNTYVGSLFSKTSFKYPVSYVGTLKAVSAPSAELADKVADITVAEDLATTEKTCRL